MSMDLSKGGLFAHKDHGGLVKLISLDRRLFKPDCVNVATVPDNVGFFMQASEFERTHEPLSDLAPLHLDVQVSVHSQWIKKNSKSFPATVIGFTSKHVYLENKLGFVQILTVPYSDFKARYVPATRNESNPIVAIVPLEKTDNIDLANNKIPDSVTTGSPWRRKSNDERIKITKIRRDDAGKCYITYMSATRLGFKDSYLEDFLTIFEPVPAACSEDLGLLSEFSEGAEWLTKDGYTSIFISQAHTLFGEIKHISYHANGIDEVVTASVEGFLSVFRPKPKAVAANTMVVSNDKCHDDALLESLKVIEREINKLSDAYRLTVREIEHRLKVKYENAKAK